jgi:tRNA dimethylallyltransferase
MDKYLIVILGPTGVGKSEMRIGTAVPDENQLNTIRHHFVRSISVEDYYSSSMFERDVLKLLPALFSENNIVLMTGGSGMYLDAVCNGTDDIPDVDKAVREKYLSLYREEGIAGLRIALRFLDPEHYLKVDLKNHKRIIRALEICDTTGKPYSSFLTRKKRERDFRVIKVGLMRTREELYKRINNRVDEMVRIGLEDEARQLIRHRHLNALNSVGYREFFDYFDGTVTRDKAIELIKRNSRRYAKRQMTWWAKDSDIRWFYAENKAEIFSYIDNIMTAI